MPQPVQNQTARRCFSFALFAIGVLCGLCAPPHPSHAQWDEDIEGEELEEGSESSDESYESASGYEDTSPDTANGTPDAEDDAFAYVEPETSTTAKVTVAAGLGAGMHESKQHNDWGTLVTGGTVAPTAAVSTSLIATTPTGFSYGGALSFVSTIGQHVVVSVPPVDAGEPSATVNTVSSPARKQEFTAAGLLRPALTDDTYPIGLPIWFGINFTGFNTEQETPVLEYTLLDLFVRPGLRVPLGVVNFELTGLLGASFAIGSDLDEARLAQVGLAYGGQLDVEIPITGPFMALLRGRYKQTGFKARNALEPFTERFMAVNLYAGVEF